MPGLTRLLSLLSHSLTYAWLDCMWLGLRRRFVSFALLSFALLCLARLVLLDLTGLEFGKLSFLDLLGLAH